MPTELRPSSKRKNTARPNKAKRLKAVPKEVVEQKLKILEQKEMENPDGEEKSVKGDNESDEEIENVSDDCRIVERIFIEFETNLNRRKTKRWETRRWTTMATTRTTISTTAKGSTMKMTIWMTGMVLSTRSFENSNCFEEFKRKYRENNEK
jgi:hypothetical protein